MPPSNGDQNATLFQCGDSSIRHLLRNALASDALVISTKEDNIAPEREETTRNVACSAHTPHRAEISYVNQTNLPARFSKFAIDDFDYAETVNSRDGFGDAVISLLLTCADAGMTAEVEYRNKNSRLREFKRITIDSQKKTALVENLASIPVALAKDSCPQYETRLSQSIDQIASQVSNGNAKPEVIQNIFGMNSISPQNLSQLSTGAAVSFEIEGRICADPRRISDGLILLGYKSMQIVLPAETQGLSRRIAVENNAPRSTHVYIDQASSSQCMTSVSISR